MDAVSGVTDWAIANSVRHWVTVKPDAVSMFCEGTTRTWRELFDRASRLGQGLLDIGAQPQDRVIYLGKNSIEFFEIVVGASMAGTVSAAVNWRLLSHEVRFIVNHCQATVLFVESEFLNIVDKVRDELTSVERVIVIGGDGGVDDYEAWLDAHVAEDPQVVVAESDTSIQMYTSGTTGLPKGVMFSSASIRAYDSMVAEIGVDSDSVLLVSMPVFHAAGASLGILAMREGATTAIAREVVPQKLLDLIEQQRVTMTTLVPAVLKMLLETPGIERRDLSSLDTIAYSASPISPDLLRACLARFGCRFLQIYGMTETNSATVLRPEDHLDPVHPERMLSVGRPLPEVSVRVVDALTGIDAAEGEFGEVWISAPTNMSGYWDAPAETAATMTADGYIRSGDGGYLSGGYLYLKDRIKDMIVSGGENVYPIEVENVLVEHPAINDVAVIGVPSEKWGETVKAVVVRQSSAADLTSADVIAYAKQNLAGYKCPTSVEFVDALPRNASGKILKRVLRETFVS
jgi:long-chain acyl-CoA synthetase